MDLLWELKDLRNKIKLAVGMEKSKLQNRYINRCRKLKTKMLEGSDPKKVWHLTRKKEKPIKIEKEGSVVEQANELVELFKTKFCRVTLTEHKPNLERATLEHREAINSAKHWGFKYVTPFQVLERIKSMKTKRSAGPDEVPSFFLKKIARGISDNVARLINMMICRGSYPSRLGSCKIRPCYKGRGLENHLENYRPIGIKSALAKLIDSILFGDQLTGHLENHLTPNIFAYRSGIGTEEAVMRIRETIVQEVGKKHKVALISWDVKRAFEDLPHGMILAALKNMGADHTVLSLYRSYLVSQSYYVQIGDAKSQQWMSDHRGLSQGSHIAGPTYNLSTLGHTNKDDMEVSTRYSDDDTEIVSAESIAQLRVNVRNALQEKKRRVENTGLTLQPDKTKILEINCKLGRIQFDEAEILPVKSMKHLGSWLQSDLKPRLHVERVCGIIRGAAARIKALGDVPPRMKLPTYYAWAQSAVTYNAGAYLPYTNQKQLKRIQVGLNNALRAAANAPNKVRDASGKLKYRSAAKLRKKFGVPSVEQLRKLCICKWTWKVRERLEEEQRNLIESKPIVTRNRTDLRLSICRGLESRSINNMCRKMWTEMPLGIKKENNPRKARRLIKNFVFDRGRKSHPLGATGQPTHEVRGPK